MIAAAVQRGNRFDLNYLEHIEGMAFFQSTQEPDLTGGLFLSQIKMHAAAIKNDVRNAA